MTSLRTADSVTCCIPNPDTPLGMIANPSAPTEGRFLDHNNGSGCYSGPAVVRRFCSDGDGPSLLGVVIRIKLNTCGVELVSLHRAVGRVQYWSLDGTAALALKTRRDPGRRPGRFLG